VGEFDPTTGGGFWAAAGDSTTLFWQWMRLPGDVVFALGALLMAWDFIVKLRPLYPQAVERIILRTASPLQRRSGAAE